MYHLQQEDFHWFPHTKILPSPGSEYLSSPHNYWPPPVTAQSASDTVWFWLDLILRDLPAKDGHEWSTSVSHHIPEEAVEKFHESWIRECKSPAQVINFLPPQSLPEKIGIPLISFRNLSFHRTGLTRINRPLVLLNFDATSIQGNLQVTFLTSQVLKSRKKFNSFPGKEKRSEKGNLFQDFWWICYGNSLGFMELWNYDMGNVCEFYFHISLIFLSTLAMLLPMYFKNIQNSQAAVLHFGGQATPFFLSFP